MLRILADFLQTDSWPESSDDEDYQPVVHLDEVNEDPVVPPNDTEVDLANTSGGDLISKRTRAQYSLADVQIEELEGMVTRK